MPNKNMFDQSEIIKRNAKTISSLVKANDGLSVRLQEYLDTGLSPAEIAEHEEIFKSYRHICGGKSPEEIQAMLTKLENGTLVELPCRVGNIIYSCEKGNTHVWESKVTYIKFSEKGIRIGCENFEFPADYLGKVKFLTPDEAYTKLEKLNSHE